MEDIARDTSPRFVPNILGSSYYIGCCKSERTLKKLKQADCRKIMQIERKSPVECKSSNCTIRNEGYCLIFPSLPSYVNFSYFLFFFLFLNFFPSVFVFLVSRLPHTSPNPYRDQAWHTQSLKTGRWICNANNAHCAHSACAMFNADNAHNDIKAQCTVPNAQCPMFNFQCPIPNAKFKTLCSQYLNQCSS